MKKDIIKPLEQFLPFNLPDLGEEEIASVVETLRSGWITTGPKTKQFEVEFADFLGAKHAVSVNSCTAALHLALEALGVKEGDEVLVPTMTFAATAEIVHYLKAKPVLVDCDPRTFNIDLVHIERCITPRTKVLIPVHFAGQPCDMDGIQELASKHGLRVVEDAAHSLPATYKGRMVGTISDITCFSFYATKTITTGEGGMITTDDDALADRMRIMSLHGISRDAWKRYTSTGSWRYDILYPGFKYNLTDIASAIGLEQLKKCRAFYERRRKMVAEFNQAFADLDAVMCPTEQPDVQHAWHLYVLQLVPERLTITRDQFMNELRALSIGASVHFIPLHLHPYYVQTFGYKPQDLPNASRLAERVISLPLYTKMTTEEHQYVIEAVRHLVRRFAR